MKLALFLVFAMGAAQAKVVGKIYKKGETEKPIMMFERTDTIKENEILATSTFKEMDGKTLMEDQTVYDKEFRLKEFKIDHQQLGYKGQIRKVASTVEFDYSKNGKPSSTETEKASDDLVVGPLLSLFIRKNWTEIVGGEDVGFRMAIPDRQETINFNMSKVEDREINGKKYTTIKMSPSSFIVRAVVDDIYFMFDENKNLRVYEGRLTVKHQQKDLDATVFYDYQEN